MTDRIVLLILLVLIGVFLSIRLYMGGVIFLKIIRASYYTLLLINRLNICKRSLVLCHLQKDIIFSLIILTLTIPISVNGEEGGLGATPIAQFDPTVDPVCGGLANAHGPFDYRRVNKKEKDLVEDVHFNPQEKMLYTYRVYKDDLIWGEFDYTLRAFPNNPRALMAINKLSLLLKNEKPLKARYTAECYFKRAVRFMPDDYAVRVVYSIYLYQRNRFNEAAIQLEQADKLSPNSSEIHYNLGLTYFELKNHEKSRMHAKRAYELGYPLPGLKKKLKRAGYWD